MDSKVSDEVRENIVKKTKIEKDVVHTCAFDLERMEHLERQVEELGQSVGSALTQLHEDVSKCQGMLKFCYAICQNPGIKDLADRNRGFTMPSFGPYGARGNGASGGNNGSSNGVPRASNVAFVPRP